MSCVSAVAVLAKLTIPIRLHQDDIRRVGGDIRGRREGQSDLQCAVTVNL